MNMHATDAAGGGCGGRLDFASMHAVAPSRGFPHATSSYSKAFYKPRRLYTLLYTYQISVLSMHIVNHNVYK